MSFWRPVSVLNGQSAAHPTEQHHHQMWPYHIETQPGAQRTTLWENKALYLGQARLI